MIFWFWMLFFDLLIPVTLILLGTRFRKGGPKAINGLYGYRTVMSMKNQETWEFAHRYCGKIWVVSGWMTLVLSVLILIFFIGESTDTIGMAGLWICGLQIIPMILSVVYTEKALRKHFDANGNRK